MNDRLGKCVPVKLSLVLDKCFQSIIRFHGSHPVSAWLFLRAEQMHLKKFCGNGRIYQN